MSSTSHDSLCKIVLMGTKITKIQVYLSTASFRLLTLYIVNIKVETSDLQNIFNYQQYSSLYNSI